MNNTNDNLKGGFAFRNRGGQVAYKDIKLIIDGNDVLNDDLKNGTGKWIIKADNWEAKNGILVNKFDEIKSHIWMVNNNWKDYSLQLKVKMIQGEGGIHINFLNGGGGNCSLNLTETNFNITQLTGEGKGQILKKNPNKLIEGKWYDIKIDIKSKNLKCYIDSELFAATKLYGSLSDGNIYSTAGIGNKNKELIVKIVNSSQKNNTCKLIIQGKDFRPDGDAVIISSTDQDDENSLTNPFYVKPISTKLHNISSSFFYQMSCKFNFYSKTKN